MTKLIVGLLAFALSVNSLHAQTVTETPEQQQQRMQWWEDARFGMFIHWGIYSVPAGVYKGNEIPGIGEWIMNHGKIPMAEYQQYAAQFNPIKFDADKIVALAKAAGMKYIVITSKHHDGFAMFKSTASDLNIVDATPFKRDVIAEMAAACKKQGIRFGLYYSQAQDWNHPGGAANGGYWDKGQEGNMDDYIDKIAIPQIREILTHYGPISVLWFDTPTGMTPERAARIYPLLKLQPGIIINNRLGGGIGGDLETPEQYIPATGFPGRNWESCMTMNDTWGYKKNDKNFKSIRVLIQNLVDIASKGGNYLLNIGPTSEGLVPEESVVRLQQMGKWMDTNSEAIYGTTAGPFNYLSWGRATRKGQTLYLSVFNWPAAGLLHVPLKNHVEKAYLLATGKELAFKTADGGVSNGDIANGASTNGGGADGSIADGGIDLTLPTTPPDSIASVIVLKFRGEPVVPPIPSLGKTATASSEASADDGAAKAFDGNLQTAWHAAKTDTSAWIQVDLGEAVKISAVFMKESGERERKIKAYRFEVRDGAEWKPLFEGNRIGQGTLRSITPVTGRIFRLLVTGAAPGIQLCEMSLLSE
jgi:alpha-L-fucosidase